MASTGKGPDAGTPGDFNVPESVEPGTGKQDGGYRSTADSLEETIKKSSRAKSALTSLSATIGGTGKRRVEEYRDVVRELNDELEKTTKHLDEINERGGVETGTAGGGGGAVGASGSYTKSQMPQKPSGGGGLVDAHGQPISTPQGADAAAAAAAGAGGTRQGAGGDADAAGRPGGWRTAGKVGLAAGATALFAAGTQFESRREMRSYMDDQQIRGAMGGARGTSQDISDFHRGLLGTESQFGSGGFRSHAEIQAAQSALQAGGINIHSPRYAELQTDLGDLATRMPGMDVEGTAGSVGQFMHGEAGRMARRKGIIDWDMGTDEVFRQIIRRSAGGPNGTDADVTRKMIMNAVPGQPFHDNIMALVGGDMALTQTILDFAIQEYALREQGLSADTMTATEIAEATGFGVDESATAADRFTEGAKASSLQARHEEAVGHITGMGETSRRFSQVMEDEVIPGLHNFVETMGRGGSMLSQIMGAGGGILQTLGAYALGAWKGKGGPAAGKAGLGSKVLSGVKSAGATILGGVKSGGGKLLGFGGRVAGGGFAVANMDMTGHPIWGWEDDPEKQQQMLDDVISQLRSKDPDERQRAEVLLSGMEDELGVGDPDDGTFLRKSWVPGEPGAGVGDPGSGGGRSPLKERTHHPDEHVTGLHPQFRANLERMFADNPRLRLNSGYRSVKRQTELWNEAIRKYGSESAARKWVAPPGGSYHNKGLAADVGPQSEYGWLARNASKYGMTLPMSHEPWHLEPQGARSGQFKGYDPESGSGGHFEEEDEPHQGGEEGKLGPDGGGEGFGDTYGSAEEADVLAAIFGGGGSGSGDTPTGGGGFTAQDDAGGEAGPGGGGSLGDSFETGIEAFLYGLRMHESGNRNIVNQGGHSTASGYYQYVNGTWAGYGGYSRAIDAPFEVQHQRAKEDARRAFERFQDWEKVAANHIYPAWANDPGKWNQTPAPGNPTIQQYVNSVISKAKGSQGAGGDGVGDPPSSFTEIGMIGAGVGDAPSSTMPTPAPAAPVAAPPPSSMASAVGGGGNVNVTFKIERATYSEAERFAEWVMDITERRKGKKAVANR